MDIENGTNDDAKVKVSGGGGGPGQMPKDGRQERVWDLAPRQKLTLPDDVDAGCVIKISVEMEVGRHEVTPPTRPTAIKGLKLTKGTKGYEVTPVTNGKPGPKPGPKPGLKPRPKPGPKKT